MPPIYSWVAELLQRAPAYVILSGLYLYYALVISPAREAWWWAQLSEHQRKEDMAAVELANRQEKTIATLEDRCYELAAANSRLLAEHHKMIMESSKLVESGTKTIFENNKLLLENNRILQELHRLEGKPVRR